VGRSSRSVDRIQFVQCKAYLNIDLLGKGLLYAVVEVGAREDTGNKCNT
jgi:hypothetical protein